MVKLLLNFHCDAPDCKSESAMAIDNLLPGDEDIPLNVVPEKWFVVRTKTGNPNAFSGVFCELHKVNFLTKQKVELLHA